MATMAQAKRKEVKKHQYQYVAKDKKGKKVKGEMTATSPALVKAQLRKQNLRPVSVQKSLFSFGSAGKRIKPGDIAVFTRQLATMTKAGVPLLQGFEIIQDGSENPNMANLIQDIKNDVAAGSSFNDALRKHPKYFTPLYCSLIEAGESSGKLEGLLDRIAVYLEKSEALKQKIKKALTYPAAVIVVAIIVMSIIMIKVVPTFSGFFASMDAELPALTKAVVAMSNFLVNWWFVAMIGILILVYVIKNTHKKSKAFRDSVDRGVLRLPIVGEIVHEAAVARFARTLSTTFAAGVPLVESLDSVAGAAGNVVYYDATRQIQDDVSAGVQLNFAMQKTGVFPMLALQLTDIGEESGRLDEMLDKVANHFETAVDDKVENLTKLLEPIIMSVLGIFVGFLMLALYMPIFQLGDVVG
jgi:type IV pilus assembly protein PilC